VQDIEAGGITGLHFL